MLRVQTDIKHARVYKKLRRMSNVYFEIDGRILLKRTFKNRVVQRRLNSQDLGQVSGEFLLTV
jgi:hypothetical protein